MKPMAAALTGAVLALCGITLLGLVDLMALAAVMLSVASRASVAGL
jgi:hypothetical protein